MTLRDKLSPILRIEEAADLTAATRGHLGQLAHDAQTEGQLVLLRDECGAGSSSRTPRTASTYLVAAACALHGEIERATQTLLALGDGLAAERAWDGLAAGSVTNPRMRIAPPQRPDPSTSTANSLLSSSA